MKIQAIRIRSVAIMAASTLFAIPAFAAPHLDPKVVGSWHGVLSAKQNGPAQIDIIFRPDGTDVFKITAPKDVFTIKGNYTTKPGKIVMTAISATENGRPAPHNKATTVNYKVTATTLTLDHGTQEEHVVLHRVKG